MNGDNQTSPPKPLPKQQLNLPDGSYIRYKDIYILPVIKRTQVKIPPLRPKLYPIRLAFGKTLQIIHHPSVLYFIPTNQKKFRLILSKAALANTVAINKENEKWFVIGLSNGMVQLKSLDEYQQECYTFKDQHPTHIAWKSLHEIIVATNDGQLYIMNLKRFMKQPEQAAAAATMLQEEPDIPLNIEPITWSEEEGPTLNSIQQLTCEGDWLAVLGNHKLWLFYQCKLVQVIQTYFGNFTCLNFASNNLLAVGGQDDRIHILYLDEEKQRWHVASQCVGHYNFVTDITFDPHVNDPQYHRLLSVGEDGNLGFWDIPKEHSGSFASSYNTIQQYPIEDDLTTIYPQLIQTINTNRMPLLSICVTPKFVKILCNQLMLYSFHRPNTHIKETKKVVKLSDS